MEMEMNVQVIEGWDDHDNYDTNYNIIIITSMIYFSNNHKRALIFFFI